MYLGTGNANPYLTVRNRLVSVTGLVHTQGLLNPVTVILAGGDSTRFGSDKLVAEIDGVGMLERVIRAARGVSDEIYLSVGAQGDSDSHSRFHSGSWFGLPVLNDEVPDIGPIGGLYTAFRRLDATWVLLLAGDMPFITSEWLSELCANISEDCEAVVATEAAGRIHPLAGCYRASVLAKIESCIEEGNFAMRFLISTLENVHLVTFPRDILRNVNRPDDMPTRSTGSSE